MGHFLGSLEPVLDHNTAACLTDRRLAVVSSKNDKHPSNL
jgi:hypothetical protein